jgi:hypothetical protein
MSTLTVDEVLAPYGDAELVSLPALADDLTSRGVPVTRDQRREVLRSGLIHPAGATGHGRPALITRPEAAAFVAAVLLALAVGIGLTVAYRIVTSPAATVAPGRVTLRLPT